MKAYSDGGEVQKEEESGITQALRDFVLRHGGLGGGDQNEYQTAMNVDPSTATAKGYAAGGVVMPEDLDLKNLPFSSSPFEVGNLSTTLKTAGQIPQPPPMPLPPSPEATPDWMQGAAQKMTSGNIPDPLISALMSAPPQNGGATGSWTPAVPTRPAASGAGLEKIPPTTAPGLTDVLNQAQGVGKELYGAYTPEKRNELYAYLASHANSMPTAVGNTLASVGDAISKGYGRSTSDYLNQTLQGEKQSREEALGAFDAGQKGHVGEVQAGMELEKTDPNSAISKIYRQSFAPVFQNMGYSSAAIAKMPASSIETAAEMGLKYADVQSQLGLKKAMLGVQEMTAKANIQNQALEREESEAKLRAEHPVQNFFGRLSLSGNSTPESPMTKTIGNQNFIKVNGNWYHQ